MWLRANFNRNRMLLLQQLESLLHVEGYNDNISTVHSGEHEFSNCSLQSSRKCPDVVQTQTGTAAMKHTELLEVQQKSSYKHFTKCCKKWLVFLRFWAKCGKMLPLVSAYFNLQMVPIHNCYLNHTMIHTTYPNTAVINLRVSLTSGRARWNVTLYN